MERHSLRINVCIEDIDKQQLEIILRSVTDGTYAVHAEEIAAKLVDYMLQLSTADSRMGASSAYMESIAEKNLVAQVSEIDIIAESE